MKKPTLFRSLLFCCAALLAACGSPTATGPQISDYDLVWDSPSVTQPTQGRYTRAAGSMPIGNGETGLNVWVEENGDLLFYISRTDTWSELERPLKLGRVRVSLTPNPFEAGKPFQQKLSLEKGMIEIAAGEKDRRVDLRVFVQPSRDIIYVEGKSASDVQVKATLENWRAEEYTPSGGEFSALGFFGLDGLPDKYGFNASESADRFIPGGDAVRWYHLNEKSTYGVTVALQELENISSDFPDPVSGRIFGGQMQGKGMEKTSDSTLVSSAPGRNISIQIAAVSSQTESTQWIKDIGDLAAQAAPGKAADETKKWWSDYWKRSWVFVETPDVTTGRHITEGYLYQRWISTCGGKGNFPIKFNGTIFTVDPAFTDANLQFSPDMRRWGGAFWWQNTRLPYYAMLASGDFEMIKVLFKFYNDRVPAFKNIAKRLGAEGIVIPETMSVYGTYTNSDYGWGRTDLPTGVAQTPWVSKIWVQSLELSFFMLDYYFYTGDKEFLTGTAVPFIRETLKYFDTRFGRDAGGKLLITPTQSLETYWYDVVNDAPCVVGLHAILAVLPDLPSDIGTAEDREMCQRLAAALPPVPTDVRDGKKVFAVAQQFKDQASNVENPELYIVYPFRLCNLTTADKETGVESFRTRRFPDGMGWYQDGQQAATLGLTDYTSKVIVSKVNNTNPNHRFQAIWGPNFDWTPDQDHGSNMLATLQTMLLQSYDDTLYVLPAFPADWNVSFRLFAPGNAQVTCEYRDGELKTSSTDKNLKIVNALSIQ